MLGGGAEAGIAGDQYMAVPGRFGFHVSVGGRGGDGILGTVSYCEVGKRDRSLGGGDNVAQLNYRDRY